MSIIAFAFGVLLLQWQPALPDGRLWLLVGVLGALPAMRWQRWPAVLLALLACCAMGFGWAAWRAEQRLSERLPADWEGRDIAVQGIIAGLPQDFGEGVRFDFAVEQVSTAAARVPHSISLSWYRERQKVATAGPPSLHPGERWQLTIRLKRPHGNANPGGFDYEVWLLERNIRATGYVRPGPAQRLTAMVWHPAYVIERLRDDIRATFERMLPAAEHPLAGVLTALAIGDQKAVARDLWTTFNRTGTTHLMSISGLHVTMVAAIFGWLVLFAWRRVPALANRWPAQKAGVLAAAIAALAFALLAGFAVPAQRTFYMLAVAALATLSGRIVAPSRVLCLALLAVVLIDPWSVLAAGFWLSFGAVGALLYIGAGATGEGQGWRWRLRSWGAVQWAATLASLPVLLLVFQQFSLVSPLANAVAIPVVSFVVTPLALLAVLLPWPPILAVDYWILEWLMRFLDWCAGWPVWQAPAPPLWIALVAALGVAVCLLPRGFPGRALGILMILPAAFWPIESPPAGEAWIDILDVGQGLASVIRTQNHTLVYDPGPRYSATSDAGQQVVVPYLRWLGLNRVDLLIVTHRDTDHSGGTESLRGALAVGEIRSSVPELGGQPCAAGQQWTWDGVNFEMLHPAPDSDLAHEKSNHLSCVLRVSSGTHHLLLTSDIEAPDEAALLERAADRLAADVLLMPHHGSRTSSTPAFLDAVAARQVIIPVGYRNRYGHPKAEVLERYAARDMIIWRTDRDGAVDLRMAPAGVALHAWRREHRRYWHGQ